LSIRGGEGRIGCLLKGEDRRNSPSVGTHGRELVTAAKSAGLSPEHSVESYDEKI